MRESERESVGVCAVCEEEWGKFCHAEEFLRSIDLIVCHGGLGVIERWCLIRYEGSLRGLRIERVSCAEGFFFFYIFLSLSHSTKERVRGQATGCQVFGTS